MVPVQVLTPYLDHKKQYSEKSEEVWNSEVGRAAMQRFLHDMEPSQEDRGVGGGGLWGGR